MWWGRDYLVFTAVAGFFLLLIVTIPELAGPLIFFFLLCYFVFKHLEGKQKAEIEGRAGRP